LREIVCSGETQLLQFIIRHDESFDCCRKVIATLGPSGTSSEFAAKHLTDDVQLFNSYEKAEEFVIKSKGSAAFLVANAYQDVNKFYISRKSKPIAAFFLDTPSYVLATKHGAINLRSTPMRVASHRAPAHLISKLIPNCDHIIIEVFSTGEAARLAMAGEVDACLTTQLACEKNGLIKMVDTGVIPMLWTVFAGRGDFND